MTHKISLSLAAAGVLASCGVLPDEPVGSQSAALTAIYLPMADTWAYPGIFTGRDHGVSRELRTNNILAEGAPNYILLRFPVNLGAVCPTLGTATLRMQSAQLAGPLQVAAHRVLDPWAPGNTGAAAAMGCMANSGMSAPFNIPAFAAPLPPVLVNLPCAPYAWDITPIVQAWCAGAPNRGVMMGGRQGQSPANFFSMESPAWRPSLEIVY